MKNPIKKFLEFNGRTITFLSIDGAYWIAIKPICEALKVNFDRQYKNIVEDDIFGQLYAKQPMTGTDGKTYNMVSIPEKYVYGWLLSIKSKSPELKEYKLECYNILFNHFHGTISGRLDLLKKKTDLQKRAGSIEKQLVDHEAYNELLSVNSDIKAISKELTLLDKQVVSEQMDIWNSDNSKLQ